VTIPNLVEVPVGNNGQVTMYNDVGSADVIVDIEGYVGTSTTTGAGLYNPLTPTRICDTRAAGGYATANQCNVGGPGTMGPFSTMNVTVTGGTTGVPATGASAVVLNITVADTNASSYLTAWPTGGAQPTASNLNWVPGNVIANRVVVPVGTNGQISLYNHFGNTDVIVDVTGWYSDGNTQTTGSLYVPVTPTRICDTRAAGGYAVANQCNVGGVGTLAALTTKNVTVTGTFNGQSVAGVPANATAAVLNVTVTNTTFSSYLSAWPEGLAQPSASDLNWSPGQTIPNLVIATLPSTGPDAGTGGISLFNHFGSTDAIVDVEGYYVPSA
jgi:hypothetical protein